MPTFCVRPKDHAPGCLEAMCYRLVTGPSASPPAAVLTANTRGLREKWGVLHCGTSMVACRDLPTPHLGWQLQPAREGEASAAALLRSGLFWLQVCSLSFCVS